MRATLADTAKIKSQYIGEETGAVFQGRKVTYLNELERQQYKLVIKDGKLYDANGKIFDTGNAKSLFGGKGNAIFVMDESGSIFASKTQSVGKFHHSSFLSGSPVAAAGELVVSDGRLLAVTRRSGHYQPTPAHLKQFITELQKNNVDLKKVNIGEGF